MLNNRTKLSKVGDKAEAKDIWAAVRRLTGSKIVEPHIEGITAEALNNHYAAISTDSSYRAPQH